MSELKHSCGLFGVTGQCQSRAGYLICEGLSALQHRGEEGAGIITINEGKFVVEKGPGLVSQTFNESKLDRLAGNTGIGHTRYATTGVPDLKNVQPFSVTYIRGEIALAHNGNLVNTNTVRTDLERDGSVFISTTDSEVMLHLIARHLSRNSNHTLEQAIRAMMNVVKGSYSLIVMTNESLVAVRDPNGFRPLCLGNMDGIRIIASESCALKQVGAHFKRSLEPGEIVTISLNGKIVSSTLVDTAYQPLAGTRFCVQERIYFARPDSVINGETVALTRIKLGRRLALEFPISNADIVVPVPSGGIYPADGYAEEMKLPIAHAFGRSHYFGRSFIASSQKARKAVVNGKLFLIQELVEGKSVVVVDDSIIRGTTSMGRIKGLRQAGAREVHMLSASPPYISGCYYGTAFPDKSKLIAVNRTLEQIKGDLDLDSLGFLSLEGLMSVMGPGHCDACHTGKYPVPIEDTN